MKNSACKKEDWNTRERKGNTGNNYIKLQKEKKINWHRKIGDE
jgi:hypothetical protein